MKWRFLVLLLVMSSAYAEQPWPKQIASAKFAEASTSTLPVGLRDAMLHYDEFSQGTDKLAESYQICQIDLNGDGSQEYIIMSRQGYSGGPQMYVFRRRQKRFDCIADFAGRIYFGSRRNGYLQIISQSRGGAGMSTRSLYRYQDDRYHLVRLADYQLREFGGGFDFVQERDPKPYDN